MSFWSSVKSFFTSPVAKTVEMDIVKLSAQILLAKYQPKISQSLQNRGLNQEVADQLSQQLTNQLLVHVGNFQETHMSEVPVVDSGVPQTGPADGQGNPAAAPQI